VQRAGLAEKDTYLRQIRAIAKTLRGNQELLDAAECPVPTLLQHKFAISRAEIDRVDVTCCIAFGKDHDFLPEALQSLEKQSIRPSEILVGIDNSSTEDPLRKSENGIRYVLFEGNHGPFAVMDRLIREARSTYVLILDSDDICHPHRIECLLSVLKRYSLDLVGSAVAYFSDVRKSVQQFGIFPPDPRKALFQGYCHAILYPTILMRRSLYVEIGRFSRFDYFGMDTEFTLRAVRLGRAVNVAFPLYLKRHRATSLTHAASTGMESRRRARIETYTQGRYHYFYRSGIALPPQHLS
jgi:GT2 family glycosyltransferase